MRIAIASVFLGQIARGVETWAADLAAELHRRQMDVTLFQSGPVTVPYARQLRCLDHRAVPARLLARLGRHGGWRRGWGSPMTVQQVSFANQLTRELRAGRYDIVHMQDAWASRVLETNRRKGLHNAQVILGHGTEESLEFLAHFDHVQELAPCYLAQDRLQTADRRLQTLSTSPLPLTPSPAAGWFAIPNFVDCERFKPGDRQAARKKFNLPEDAFIVLDVAALKRTHKRLDWLAEEVAEASGKRQGASGKRDGASGKREEERGKGQESAVCRLPSAVCRLQSAVFLVVAGAKTGETDALLPVMQAALGDRLRVLTDLRRDDMPDLYRAADVFAHAALQEMMPIALIEAMASGLPVIANQAPIFEWIIGDAGTLVDATSPHALAHALTPYLMPQFRAGKSAAARQRAVAMFSADVVVEQIVEMYEQVLGNKL